MKAKYCKSCKDGSSATNCKRCPEQVVIGAKKIILDGDVCITGERCGGWMVG